MSQFFLHIAIITILDVIGNITAKFWSINKNPLFLLLTVVFFGGAGFFFARSLRYEGMAITNVLWIALSVIIVTLIGYFAFKEELAPVQIIGILAITIGLVLINLK